MLAGGAEMRVVLQILVMIAAVIVAAVGTYFIVTFLLQFF
jgi:succinate dehydrogenase hydrophobic anchor subunit